MIKEKMISYTGPGVTVYVQHSAEDSEYNYPTIYELHTAGLEIDEEKHKGASNQIREIARFLDAVADDLDANKC